MYVLVEGVTASVCSIIGLFVCLFTCCVCTDWGSIPESCCQSLIDQDWRRTYTYTCTYAYMYRYRYRDMTSGLFHFMAFTCSSFLSPPISLSYSFHCIVPGHSFSFLFESSTICLHHIFLRHFLCIFPLSRVHRSLSSLHLHCCV